MHEEWSEEGRKVKFVRLLGAALNTGIINVVERRALAEHSLLFKGPPVGIGEGDIWQESERERERPGDSQIA